MTLTVPSRLRLVFALRNIADIARIDRLKPSGRRLASMALPFSTAMPRQPRRLDGPIKQHTCAANFVAPCLHATVEGETVRERSFPGASAGTAGATKPFVLLFIVIKRKQITHALFLPKSCCASACCRAPRLCQVSQQEKHTVLWPRLPVQILKFRATRATPVSKPFCS